MIATLEQIADLVRGRLIGDANVQVRAAKPLSDAGPEDITFFEDERYLQQFRKSQAAAVIVGPQHPSAPDDRSIPLIQVDNPLTAFSQVIAYFRGAHKPLVREVHPLAYVAPSAKIGANVAVFPFAYIGDDVEVGDDCVIHPHVVIRERCRLGQGVELHPHVVLYPDVSVGDRSTIHSGTVLGGDGFGYRLVNGRHVKVPQTGEVEIGEDVEVGANCAIDRGTFEATRIGDGTKIDNLVMIGHNNKIGRHNLLCGQVGMAGSCVTGDYVVMAGQVGIKDHTIIGDQVIVGAQSGVHRNIPSGQQVLGSPAVPIREQRQIFAMVGRLPEMHRQLKELLARTSTLAAPTPTEEAVSHEESEQNDGGSHESDVG